MLEQPKSLGGDSRWLVMWFVVAAMLLFGGVTGSWFTSGLTAGGWISRGLQLATGSVVMSFSVAVLGSLLFGRNPIRWGMGMPLMIYFGGISVALVSGREGAIGLLYGAPLFLGLAIAAGVMGAFLIDGLNPRDEEESD